MDKRFLGATFLLRHGKSKYTNVFPDLTKEGQETIQVSAAMIAKARKDHLGCLEIISSPAVRACGSAEIVADELEYCSKIVQAELLGPAEIKDKEKGLAVYEQYMRNGGMEGLCRAYDAKDIFEDGIIFEPRSKVQKRFLKFLGQLSQFLLWLEFSPPFIVAVSHYECMYKFLEQVFPEFCSEKPLDFGEFVELLFFDIGFVHAVEIAIRFREKKTAVLFGINEKRIIRHLDKCP